MNLQFVRKQEQDRERGGHKGDGSGIVDMQDGGDAKTHETSRHSHGFAVPLNESNSQPMLNRLNSKLVRYRSMRKYYSSNSNLKLTHNVFEVRHTQIAGLNSWLRVTVP